MRWLDPSFEFCIMFPYQLFSQESISIFRCRRVMPFYGVITSDRHFTACLTPYRISAYVVDWLEERSYDGNLLRRGFSSTDYTRRPRHTAAWSWYTSTLLSDTAAAFQIATSNKIFANDFSVKSDIYRRTNNNLWRVEILKARSLLQQLHDTRQQFNTICKYNELCKE